MILGSSYHLAELHDYKTDLALQKVIEIENLMFPNYLETADPDDIKSELAFFEGEKIFSGPFIDLNFASPEKSVAELTKEKFYKTYELAKRCQAKEIVFLSNFIPIINLASYEDAFVENSTLFWKDFLSGIDTKDLTFSIGNTFEFDPYLLLEIIKKVNHPQLKLTFDLGHFLVYSKISIEEWVEAIKVHCSTVYLHSNNGKQDTHDNLFDGVLTYSQLNYLKRELSTEVNFLFKANDRKQFNRNLNFFKEC